MTKAHSSPNCRVCVSLYNSLSLTLSLACLLSAPCPSSPPVPLPLSPLARSLAVFTKNGSQEQFVGRHDYVGRRVAPTKRNDGQPLSVVARMCGHMHVCFSVVFAVWVRGIVDAQPGGKRGGTCCVPFPSGQSPRLKINSVSGTVTRRMSESSISSVYCLKPCHMP